MRDDMERRLEDLGRVLGTTESVAPEVMDRIEQVPGDQPAETRTMKRGSSVR